MQPTTTLPEGKITVKITMEFPWALKRKFLHLRNKTLELRYPGETKIQDLRILLVEQLKNSRVNINLEAVNFNIVCNNQIVANETTLNQLVVPPVALRLTFKDITITEEPKSPVLQPEPVLQPTSDLSPQIQPPTKPKPLNLRPLELPQAIKVIPCKRVVIDIKVPANLQTKFPNLVEGIYYEDFALNTSISTIKRRIRDGISTRLNGSKMKVKCDISFNVDTLTDDIQLKQLANNIRVIVKNLTITEQEISDPTPKTPAKPSPNKCYYGVLMAASAFSGIMGGVVYLCSKRTNKIALGISIIGVLSTILLACIRESGAIKN